MIPAHRGFRPPREFRPEAGAGLGIDYNRGRAFFEGL